MAYRLLMALPDVTRLTALVTASALIFTACTRQPQESTSKNTDSSFMDTLFAKGTFAYDVDFLKQHHPDVVELYSEDAKARIVILPAYQGRVMTSTATGMNGSSFGWINYDLIASGKQSNHMHAFGGEERFWLGPEGGQFSIYFMKGVPFTYDNWQVPKQIDTESFELVSSTATEARFTRDMHFENYSGTPLDLKVNRNIRLLTKSSIDSLLGINISAGIEVVGFESENMITNTGTKAWTKKTGLLSIWILSMMNASEKTTVAIPFEPGDEKTLGRIVTDDYFGKVPGDRLAIKNNLILFRTDAKFRSKIGLSPKRAKNIVSSYDAVTQVLTIATFTLPGVEDYVNSMWEKQKNPFNGDAINAYNDGPVKGAQMGNVYEIESSSPAAALAQGKSLTHFHRTIHLKGPVEELNAIATKLLGVTVDQIKL